MSTFIRTDLDSSEHLTIVSLEDDSLFWCEELGRETPYLVQVVAGDTADGDFVGIFDLDGDRVEVGGVGWVVAEDVPADVVEQIESGWATGLREVTSLHPLTDAQVWS